MKALQILVVEDDALIAMLLEETLAEMGHGVCAVEASQSGAVKAALRCRPDLMIVDVELREGNGISAVDEILSTKFFPHLYVSGDINKVLALRPNAVAIGKPFREPELIRAIHRALATADSDYKDRPMKLSD